MSGLSRNPPRRGGNAISIVVGAAVVAVVAWMSFEAIDTPHRAPAAVASVTPSATATASLDAGAPALPASASPDETDAGLFLPTLSLGDAGLMPANAPRSVKIGVVLVAFAGAEGAAPNARSKKDALVIAERLAGDAKADFHKAVTSGDSGSSDDIGRLPRGVLDPRTEIAVFGLATGEVSDVLETPRGFWIVKRVD